jgi:hypothetical protein
MTKGEFSQFSLAGRKRLLDSYAIEVAKKKHDESTHIVYSIYNFYVLVVFDNSSSEPVQIEILPETIYREIFHDGSGG